jgi:hemoglobin-like flavoprotein
MTPKQIELVQQSWEHIVKNIPQAGEIFYGRLFDVNPQLRAMFSPDTKTQAQKLVHIITFAVKKLNTIEDVVSDVQSLGRRHGNYGVQPAHYAMVADSLLWTLEKGLGHLWTDEMKQSWTTLYATLAGIMMDASAAPVAKISVI